MSSKNNKKHILIICPFSSPNVGGVETHLDKLINELVLQKKYYVTLISYQPLTTDSSGRSFEKGDGYEIHRMRWFGMDLFPKLEHYFPLEFLYLFPGLFVKSLLYYIRYYKDVDVIHAHGLVAGTIAIILSLFHKTHLVLSTHAIYDFKNRGILSFFVKHILSSFDKILAVSTVARDELIALGISSSKIGAFVNWIDTDLFKPNKILLTEYSKNKNSKSVLNVLFVGRFLTQKGINLLIDTASQLPYINFHFVGTGPLLEDVIKASKKLSNIIYHGILMQASVSQLHLLVELYSSCDYFISPYLYDEGYSTTLIESLSCGTPVIVPDRGSPPTFLNKDVAVFLPYLPDTKSIVSVLTELQETYSVTHFDKIRKKCRDYAVDNFGRKNVSIITDAYEN